MRVSEDPFAGPVAESDPLPYTALPRVELWLEQRLLALVRLQLAESVRAALVGGLPYVLTAAAFALGCYLAALAPFFYYAWTLGHVRAHDLVVIPCLVASEIALIATLPGLFRRRRAGWARLVYACSAVAALVATASLPVAVFGYAAVLWLLFHIKYDYDA
jgi:hypothetical protein